MEMIVASELAKNQMKLFKVPLPLHPSCSVPFFIFFSLSLFLQRVCAIGRFSSLVERQSSASCASASRRSIGRLPIFIANATRGIRDRWDFSSPCDVYPPTFSNYPATIVGFIFEIFSQSICGFIFCKRKTNRPYVMTTKLTTNKLLSTSTSRSLLST